jgi:hypothetical protein
VSEDNAEAAAIRAEAAQGVLDGYENAAQESADAAKVSEDNAKASELAAKQAEDNTVNEAGYTREQADAKFGYKISDLPVLSGLVVNSDKVRVVRGGVEYQVNAGNLTDG